MRPPAPHHNAFERLGLPVAFAQAPGAVQQARRERLLAVHPDRFVRAAPAARAVALAHAVTINDAARAIEGPYERVSYLIALRAGDAPRRIRDADWQWLFELKLALRELDHTDAHVERSRVIRGVAERYEEGLAALGAALDGGSTPAGELAADASLLRALRSVLEGVQR